MNEAFVLKRVCFISLSLAGFVLNLFLFTFKPTTGKLRQLYLVVRVVQPPRIDAESGNSRQQQWARRWWNGRPPDDWLAHYRWPSTHVFVQQVLVVVVARSLPLHSIYKSARSLTHHRAHFATLQTTAAATTPVRFDGELSLLSSILSKHE